MAPSPRLESALILTFPAAEPAVHEQRLALDPAAHAGVPAHVTVLYPFKPVDQLTDEDLGTITRVCAATPGFDVTFSATRWFDEDVVYLAPDDPRPMVQLITAIGDAFPDHPRYRGRFEDVTPHLTIGLHTDPNLLRAADDAVRAHLPITQRLSRLELWSGPPPTGGEGFWNRVRTFPFAF